MLDTLNILDLRREVAALPRHPQAETQPPRAITRSLTFHFSDVIYLDRSPAAERQRTLNEAGWQLRKNWSKAGRPAIYGDQYQYEWVVWSDGQIVRVSDSMEFWHCNNRTGNATSCPVHVMLGRGQALTPAQRASLFRLFDALRSEYGLPRSAVVAHCEWPLTDGAAVVEPTWRVQRGQSACPHRRLFADLAAYRAMPDGPLGRRWVADVLAWRRAAPELGDNRMADIPARTPVTGQLVAGARVTRPPYGTSDQWIAIDDGGFTWSGPFREVR